VVEVTYMPRAPYSLRASVGGPDPTRRFRGGVLELAFETGVAPARATVWQLHDGTLKARIESVDEVAAHDRLHVLLQVGLDHTPLLEMARGDALLGVMRSRMKGLRVIQLGTPAHALIRGVASQLIRAREAIAIERRIVLECGAPFGELRLPPTAARLAAVHPARFERAGLSPARAVLLSRAARLDWERLTAEPTDRVALRLRTLRGLGPFTAGCVLLRGMSRQEHGMVGDLALMRLATRLLGRPAESQDTAALLAPYGEWQGLASLWLMHHPLAARHTVPQGPAATLQA
jgi:3-methyladenine DNA glycosylase/8-oxoguanine DNA glycosylase